MKTALVTLSILASTAAYADDDPWAGEESPDAPVASEPVADEPAPQPVTVTAPAPTGAAVVIERFAASRAAFTKAFSIQLMTLDNSGLSLQAERASRARPKVSYAVSVGGRHSAQGEYSSSTVGVGFEARRWRRAGMRGLYVGARTDLARTHVEDVMEDRGIGSLTTWSVGVSTGYRWVLWNRVELAPSIGAALVVEGGMDGRSPTTARGAGVIGLTAGAIF